MSQYKNMILKHQTVQKQCVNVKEAEGAWKE
jgi:hypothetical protein